jgi:hypothetical protein
VSKIQIQDGYKETTPRGSITFNRNKIIVPHNVSVGGFEFRCKFQIEATADDAGGLATAAQTALLEAVNVTFRCGLNAGTNKERTPIDKETLLELMRDSWRLLERDAIGQVGSTTGLQGALLAGDANYLACTIFVSVAHIQFLEEAGQICGMGAPQLLDSELVFKVDSDPVAALDANSKLKGFSVDVRVIEAEDAEGDREALTPEIKVVKGNQEDSVTGPDGLTLSAEQVAAPLTGGGASDIEVVTVTVGGDIAAEDPATPTDIQAAYDNDPNTGTVEKQLAAVRTPLYLVPQTPLAKMKPGPVVIKMRDHYEDLEVRFLTIPLLTHDEVMGRIKRRAAQLGDDEEIHAVNSAMVENLGEKVNAEQLPFTGWEYFTSEDPRFHTMPGVRCKKNGTPYVHMPLQELVAGGTSYRLALADRSGGPNTAGGSAMAVLYKFGRYLPGFLISSKGLLGGMSKVALELRGLLSNAGGEVARRTGQRAA